MPDSRTVNFNFRRVKYLELVPCCNNSIRFGRLAYNEIQARKQDLFEHNGLMGGKEPRDRATDALGMESQ